MFNLRSRDPITSQFRMQIKMNDVGSIFGRQFEFCSNFRQISDRFRIEFWIKISNVLKLRFCSIFQFEFHDQECISLSLAWFRSISIDFDQFDRCSRSPAVTNFEFNSVTNRHFSISRVPPNISSDFSKFENLNCIVVVKLGPRNSLFID